MAKVTHHGQKRVKKRCGINKKAAKRAADNALERGVTHKQAKGKLKEYLSDLYHHSKAANNLRVYAEKVWIFKNNKLITVYHLPKRFKKYLQ